VKLTKKNPPEFVNQSQMYKQHIQANVFQMALLIFFNLISKIG